MKLKRHDHRVPGLQMAAMPDLIFTVLFFFMIVTHMRENTVQVQYKEPQGTNLQKVAKKNAVIDIYVGRSGKTGEYEVQVNNAIVPLDQLPDKLKEERGSVSSGNMAYLCASLQADRDTPMNIINKVKMALREASILKVNYSGTSAETPGTDISK